jgi:hypothetical protein
VSGEDLGYAGFGAAEGWTQDAVVLLAQIAGVTRESGSPRRCFRSGVARRRRSPWPRPAFN